jgi:RND family efflux transporter MFP subunit
MAYDNYQLAVQNYENAKEDYRVVLVNYKGWEDAARTTYYQSYKSAYDNLVSAYQTWNYKKGVPDDINLGAAQGAVLSAQKAFEDALTDYSSYQTLPRTEDLQSAKVNVSTAEKNFNKRFITAPFDGTVTAVFAESGRFVKEKAAAVQLDDMSGYFINLNTSEIDITKISADQKVLVEFDAIPGKVYNGIVRQIAESGKVSDSNVTFATQVEVVDADSKIKSGMTSEVTILTGEMTQVLQVPVNAILNEDGKSYVQKVNGTEIIKIEVETGLVSDNLIVVAAADLSEGDLVSVSEAAQPQQAIGTPPAFGAATPPAESSQE